VYKHKYITSTPTYAGTSNVTKIKRHITHQIQPILHINTVTRVHPKIIAHVKLSTFHRVTYLPPKKIHTGAPST